MLASCSGDRGGGLSPAIEARDSLVLGEPLELLVTGLVPGERYALTAETTDVFARRWTSQAEFLADQLGRIEPARQVPASGDYAELDELGLLWSARMLEPPKDDWEAPSPRDFNEVTLVLRHDDTELARRVLRQWIRPPDVSSTDWGEGLVADLFLPAEGGDERLPGLVFLGGSGGGKGWASRTAALVARAGYVAVGLAYFNAEGLPRHLAQVPIEPVLRALDQLAAHPSVDPERLGIVGYSKGAELGLLVASRRSDVRAIVAIAPGSAVFQGFKPPRYPTLSSWSFEGRDLPFVPNAYDDRFFETWDGMYLWYRTLSQHEEMAAAAIPVENIAGDILLLTGVEDRIWPTTYMAEQIVARLHVAKFGHGYRHLAFPLAGHGIAVPPGEPTTSVAERLGGTPAGNARARAQLWRAVGEFLSTSLAGAEVAGER